jgi:sugar lactone lactonase YvrE
MRRIWKEPDGSPYTMISLRGDLYVVEANSGQLLRVTTRGEISRVMDLSVDHPVPTAITFHDGNFYVGTFGSASTNGAAVYEITPNGKKRTLISGLNPVLGIAFYDNKLYLLETFSGEPYSPGTGRLLRISRFGKIERTQIIACGLTFPTAMALGRDGALYISNIGYGVDPTAGLGEVVRIPIDD